MEFIGKCLYLNEEKILVASDLHLGYGESLVSAGVFLKENLIEEYINYFKKIFQKVDVEKIILLGDTTHSFGKIPKKEILKLVTFLKENGEVIFIKGNHDTMIQNTLNFYIHKNYFFCHGDQEFEEMYSKNIHYWILGHGHPAITIREGSKVEKYKCFLVGNYKKRKVIVLPSFFEGNVGTSVEGLEDYFLWDFNFENFEIHVVENFHVFNFGKLKRISFL